MSKRAVDEFGVGWLEEDTEDEEPISKREGEGRAEAECDLESGAVEGVEGRLALPLGE